MITDFTKEPLGSSSPYVLFKNAQNFDIAVNSITEAIWQDRFGRNRHTWYGLEQMATEAIAAFGYITMDSFQAGATLTLPNQVLRDTSTGEYYRWDGTFPKTVPAGSTPASSGGISIGAWLSVGDAVLRGNLKSEDDDKGDALLTVKQPFAGAIAQTQHDFNKIYVSITNFGAVPAATADTATDATSAIKAALASGATDILVPPGYYYVTETLVVQDYVTLRGWGVGYDKHHATTILFRGTGARQYTVAGATAASISNPAAGLPYLADSGTRGNNYKTTDFTVAFSAGVILGKSSSLLNLAIIPWFDGISGYDDSSSYALSDSWDVGVWARNASGFNMRDCIVQGHWRKSGLLQSSSDIGDGEVPACERANVTFCAFEGMYGVSIRSPREAQAAANYGFAGTDFINCYIRGFWHQSGHLATSSMLSEPQSQPSGCLEIDGYVGPTVKIRGVQFTNCTLMNRDDILYYLDRCNEPAFIGCYFESQIPRVNGSVINLGLGSRLVSTSETVAVKMVAHSQFGIDVTPYFSVPDTSMTVSAGNSRYINAGALTAGVWNPSTAKMDDWQEPFFSGSVSWRLRNAAQTWGVRNPDNSLVYYVSADGGIFHTNYQRSLDDTYNLYRTVGGSAQALLRCYSSGNGEWGTGTARTTVTFKFDSNVLPVSAASLNVGSNALPWSNVYSQNAVTVVSDEHFKSDIQDIPDALIEAIGSVKFQMWKLKAAVAEKGDLARYHTGVIAQQVKEAISAAGLDWTLYGLITYEETAATVTQDDDGYKPVDVENCPLPVNASGYIEIVDGSDTVNTSDDGTITLARAKYMMRMEEFYAIRLAYLEKRLEGLL